MSELLRAMVGASLTTIAGFLALLFGVLPAMKNLGIILALGILTTLVSAIFMLPVLVYLYDTRRKNTLQNEKTRTIRIEYKKTKNKKQRSE